MSTLPSLLLIPSQEIVRVRVCWGKGSHFLHHAQLHRSISGGGQADAGGRTDGRLRHQNERKEMGMGDKRTDNAAKANGQFLPYQLEVGDGWRDTTPRFERSLVLERKVSL